MRSVFWIGSSLEDVRCFPQPAKQTIGYALYLAQAGEKHVDAKPLKGFSGAGTLEIVADYVGDTYRLVYTISFKDAIYVLHAFQKKIKTGYRDPSKGFGFNQESSKGGA